MPVPARGTPKEFVRFRLILDIRGPVAALRFRNAVAGGPLRFWDAVPVGL